ncbi:exostosin family protein [Parvularcula sp. LCG005]|uniref:exostosin domain-containing protein n=1 Tax=Parvularcula sp. LCG005 TaxID=3078805 RepID=UPI002941C7E8|nr:exostosin family protein [Parvularcula sp. LCG005]WOI53607.1 exostosin family protein [Parvularcula sp. LCG005]
MSRIAMTSVIAHDADWQFPAITEQFAYQKIRDSFEPIPGAYYLGFPWATLIDRLNTGAEGRQELRQHLDSLAGELKNARRVITVCQHILLEKFAGLFFDSGVTDIFWSHATIETNELKRGQDSIRLHPFPLYPVQWPAIDVKTSEQDRPILFSFVGARSNDWYLTQVRSIILTELRDYPNAIITGRDNWHYNQIVYDHQIFANTTDTPEKLVSETASDEFKDVLGRSIFSLCPSGSGPNSIRLWESIGAGAIPVILSEKYKPPGNRELWELAAEFCGENLEEVKALPARLQEIEQSSGLLARKRQALKQIWKQYGPGDFVYDVRKMWLETAAALRSNDARPYGITAKSHEFEKLDEIASNILNRGTVCSDEIRLYAGACIIQFAENSSAFRNSFFADPVRAKAFDLATAHLNDLELLNRLRKCAGASPFAVHNSVSDQRLLVALDGKHSHRTPLSYPDLSLYNRDLFTHTTTESSQLIVTGFAKDFKENWRRYADIARNGSNPYLVVVSEEPLWDTIWSPDFRHQSGQIIGEDFSEAYAIINHTNSDVFNFREIPYFTSTDDRYILHYRQMFERNRHYTPEDLLLHWKNAEIRGAFFAERRDDPKYDFSAPELDIYGLSAFRTQIASSFIGQQSMLVVGKDWERDTLPRQKLPDWHLDKLVTLDRKTFIASGLENTHQRNYITEKIFDAYATLSIPLYWASPEHRIHEIASEGSFLNLYDRTAEDSAQLIRTFEPDLSFAKLYLDTQERLFRKFSSISLLTEERRGFAERLHATLLSRLNFLR